VPVHPAHSCCDKLIEKPVTIEAKPPAIDPSSGQWDRQLWVMLVVLCGVLLLDGLDVSMVGVALPSIKSSLHLSTSQLQWVVSGYVLGYGGFLLLGGRTSDLFGRRRVLLAALGVFVVASGIAAAVNDGTLIVVMRFLKGASAAFTAPASLSMITTTFPEGPARNKALAIYTACGASGFSMGLVLGGLLTQVSWRLTFVLPVPIALAILLALPRVTPREERQAGARGSIDLLGAATVTGGMLLLVRTVVNAPTVGWGAVQTIVLLAVSVLLLAAFVITESRVANPLVRLSILRSGSLRRANIGALVVVGCYVSFQFVGTLYLQGLLHWSPIHTALAFLPGGLIVAFASPRIGGLAARYGTERLIAVGLAAFVAGYALILRLHTTLSYPAVFLPTMILIGIGFALCFPMLSIQATNGIPDAEQGVASGLVQSSFQVGGAIILAVTSAVVASHHAHTAGGVVSSYRSALVIVTAVSAAALVVILNAVIRGRRTDLVPSETVVSAHQVEAG
jgi:MFS family permease